MNHLHGYDLVRQRLPGSAVDVAADDRAVRPLQIIPCQLTVRRKPEIKVVFKVRLVLVADPDLIGVLCSARVVRRGGCLLGPGTLLTRAGEAAIVIRRRSDCDIDEIDVPLLQVHGRCDLPIVGLVIIRQRVADHRSLQAGMQIHLLSGVRDNCCPG